MRIGILRETKTPRDRRVPFTPLQCRLLTEKFSNLGFVIQPDPNRCFPDEEYDNQGVEISDNLESCDLLAGVKEVKPETLIPGKTYMFFSHTAKKQKHNRELLRALLQLKIRLIDYEYLTDNHGIRIVAFGRWAGFVGAYNALRAYGLRYGLFELKPAWKCRDKHEVLRNLKLAGKPEKNVVLTGGGRVAQGAMEILDASGYEKVIPGEFMSKNQTGVYTQLDPVHYVKRIDGKPFDLHDFFKYPQYYENTFLPYTRSSDIFIACHFWDPGSPVMMKPEDIRDPGFRIRIIADISCDIDGPLPSTLRASTIPEPFYGYDPLTGMETSAFNPGAITVMSVDNLPGELPRDASEDFGGKLASYVVPSLLGLTGGELIERATITQKGNLTPGFSYLRDFAEGKE